MRKVILIFGLLAGAIISVLLIVMVVLLENGKLSFDNSELVGYATMVIALSMIFFGIKSFRDNYQNGAIKFGKGVQIGLLITLIASCMYAVTWEAYNRVRPGGPDYFIDKYIDHGIASLKEQGAPSNVIDMATRDMNKMKELYRYTVIRFGLTIMEILPVGIAITLISAAALTRKELLPKSFESKEN